MGHQHGISHKLQKPREHGLDPRRVHDHLIRDAGKPCNLKRDRHSWIDKGAELICDLSILHLHGPDFYDFVPDRAESRGLQVKHHIRAIKRLSLFVHRNVCQIIHQITFHTVDDLKWIILIQCFYVMIRIRKSLRHSMVCDGNRLMSPVMGPFYQILYLGHTVHIAHFRMAVQLYPFLRRRVLP